MHQPCENQASLQVSLPKDVKRNLDKTADRFGLTTSFLAIHIYREVLPKYDRRSLTALDLSDRLCKIEIFWFIRS